MTEDWEGIVIRKRRGLLDGSNMYRRVTVQLADGTTKRVRVGRELWSSLAEGDTLVHRDGELTRRA